MGELFTIFEDLPGPADRAGNAGKAPRWTGTAWEYVDVYTAAETDDAIAAAVGTIDLSGYATAAALSTHAALTDAHGATAANTAGRIVARGAAGEVAVGAVTAGSRLTAETGRAVNGHTIDGFSAPSVGWQTVGWGWNRTSDRFTMYSEFGGGNAPMLDFIPGFNQFEVQVRRHNGPKMPLVLNPDGARVAIGTRSTGASGPFDESVALVVAGPILAAAPGSPLPTPDGTSAAQFGGTVKSVVADTNGAAQLSALATGGGIAGLVSWGSGVGAGLGGKAGFGSSTGIVVYTDSAVPNSGSGSFEVRTGGYETTQRRLVVLPSGRTLFGPTIPSDDGTSALQVGGDGKFTGNVYAAGVAAGSMAADTTITAGEFFDGGAGLRISGTQVVGPQGTAVADCDPSDLDNVGDTLNTLLARLRAGTGHGLFAA
jgi:hypothetical protein